VSTPPLVQRRRHLRALPPPVDSDPWDDDEPVEVDEDRWHDDAPDDFGGAA
jgi:hypothetical protein